MSTVAARSGGGAGTPQLVLVAIVVALAAFGAAFGVAKLTEKETSAGTVQHATPIKPSSTAPKLPSAPPAAALPTLKAAPAPQGGGGAPAPPSATPAPVPPSGGGGGGGGGGPIIEG
jgi:hypothetical protein